MKLLPNTNSDTTSQTLEQDGPSLLVEFKLSTTEYNHMLGKNSAGSVEGFTWLQSITDDISWLGNLE